MKTLHCARSIILVIFPVNAIDVDLMIYNLYIFFMADYLLLHYISHLFPALMLSEANQLLLQLCVHLTDMRAAATLSKAKKQSSLYSKPKYI